MYGIFQYGKDIKVYNENSASADAISIFCSCLFPLVVQQVPHAKTTSIHVPHTSVVAPLLLKEKDEKEHDNFASISDLAPL